MTSHILHCGEHFALIWMPDSRAVIVNAGVRCNPETRELWVVPVDVGPPHTLDTGTARVRNDAPGVSPDGRQVAFQSGDDPVFEIRVLKYAKSGP